jgi:hypothetical protein
MLVFRSITGGYKYRPYFIIIFSELRLKDIVNICKYIYIVSSYQRFPKCVPQISKDPRPVPSGSVDTVL